MFEDLKVQEAEKQNDCIEFLELYARFKQDLLDPAADRIRMAKFEIKIDNAWRALPQGKQEILAEALVSKHLLPEEIRSLIRIFKARIIKIV